MKECNICLASNAAQYKLYNDLESLLVPIYCWKNLLIDFVTDLSILTDEKRDSYDSILVIIDRLTKMVHYKQVKVTIDIPDLAKIIINIVMKYHDLLESTVTDRGFFLTSKFWSLLCYFFGIKQRLSIAFLLQMDSLINRQNSIMKAYFPAFANFEKYDSARILLMAEFAYNDAKNASTGLILFELNYGYQP